MKYLTILLLLCSTSFAQEVTKEREILGGSITEHYFPAGRQHFITKLGDDGKLIYNPMLGVRTVEHDSDYSYTSKSYFVGNNSIAKPMAGFVYSSGFKVDNWQVGALVGAYAQDARPFYDRNIQLFYLVIPIQPVVDSGLAITPLIGVELNYKIKLSEHTHFIWMNVITPVLYNTNIGIGWDI